MQAYLEFEKPVADLEGKIRELQSMGGSDSDSGSSVNLDEDISRLKDKSQQALSDLYKKLSPWQKTQVARHRTDPSVGAGRCLLRVIAEDADFCLNGSGR